MQTHGEQHSGEAISYQKVTPYTDDGIVLTSGGIDPDGWIFGEHAASIENRSPPLEWDAVEGAGAYALIVEDPDAPRHDPFIHWLIWNIPQQVTSLPDSLPNEPQLISPQGVIQGRNGMGGYGWFGPKPPPGHGVHHYHFQLFALDGSLELGPDTDVQTLVDAIKGRTIAKGDLVGLYETPDTEAKS